MDSAVLQTIIITVAVVYWHAGGDCSHLREERRGVPEHPDRREALPGEL
jgi:hypothetical protein